jgi:hypothetical protein
MPFTGSTFTHLFDWVLDPQRNEKIKNERFEAELDGIDTALSSLAAGTAIANNAVTNAKLADMAQATVKGRAAGAGTGDPTDLTAAQLVAVIATADGSGSGLDADRWRGAAYTVSTSGPSGGADGDFWFEREA